MAQLTDVINGIKRDILEVFAKNNNEPLTQGELYKKRDATLRFTSEFGWSFALEKLEKEKLICMSGTIYNGEILYKLTNV